MKRILTLALLLSCCCLPVHADQAQVDAVDAAIAAKKASIAAQAAADKALQDLLTELLAKVEQIRAALGTPGPGPVVPPISDTAAKVKAAVLASVTDYPGRAAAAGRLSAAFKSVAAQPFASLADFQKATKAAESIALGDESAKWAAFWPALSGIVNAAAPANLAAAAALWLDVAAGLEAAK